MKPDPHPAEEYLDEVISSVQIKFQRETITFELGVVERPRSNPDYLLENMKFFGVNSREGLTYQGIIHHKETDTSSRKKYIVFINTNHIYGQSKYISRKIKKVSNQIASFTSLSNLKRRNTCKFCGYQTHKTIKLRLNKANSQEYVTSTHGCFQCMKKLESELTEHLNGNTDLMLYALEDDPRTNDN